MTLGTLDKVRDDVDFIIEDWNRNDEYSFPSRPFLFYTVASSIPFEYLDILFENNPEHVADLGCGINQFKRYYPNIVGYDQVESPWSYLCKPDIVCDVLSDDFITKHHHAFDCAFSINCWHFKIKTKTFVSDVIEFASMIKPGGRGFITLNSAHIGGRDISLDNFPYKILKYYNDEVQYPGPAIDGDIRLLFQK